jgi:hypothetical protein
MSVRTRILGHVDNLMFNGGQLRLALDEQAKKMAAAVEAEPEESLAQAEADEWAASLAHHFAVACPELKTGEVWREPVREIGIDVSRDPGRFISDPYSPAVRNYPGYRVVVHVPFEGDVSVFKLQASTRSYSPRAPADRGR